MNSGHLYYFILAFLLGIGIFSQFPLTLSHSFAILFLACIVYGIHKLHGSYDEHSLRFPLRLSLILLACGLASFRIVYDVHDMKGVEEILYEKVILTGTISSEPSKRESGIQFPFLAEKVCQNHNCKDLTGKMLVRADRFSHVEYGDRIELHGTLKKPEPFLLSNGLSFNYPEYLAKDEIYSILTASRIKIIEREKGSTIMSVLFSLKQTLLSRLDTLLPQPHAALLGGMTVGGTEGLSGALQEDFRKAGIIHIVVLSGYNITLVSEFLLLILSGVSRYLAYSVAGVGIILFGLMAGGGATIIRACIMALLVLVAKVSGRTTDITRMILLTAFIMVLHNPKILLFDPSFQLSFLATIGLIYFSPGCASFLQRLKMPKKVQEIVSETIATQLLVFPLLLYRSGELSIVALPVNLLVLWIIPVTMFLTIVAAATGLFSSTLAFPVSLLAYLCAQYILKISALFSSIQFSAITINNFSFTTMICVYTLLLLFLIKRRKTALASDLPSFS